MEQRHTELYTCTVFNILKSTSSCIFKSFFQCTTNNMCLPLFNKYNIHMFINDNDSLHVFAKKKLLVIQKSSWCSLEQMQLLLPTKLFFSVKEHWLISNKSGSDFIFITS